MAEHTPEEHLAKAGIIAERDCYKAALESLIEDAPTAKPTWDACSGWEDFGRAITHWDVAKIARAALAKAKEG